jgi:hypothetical protein
MSSSSFVNRADDSKFGGSIGVTGNPSDLELAKDYLGEPNPHYDFNSYDRFRTTNYDLPEAYRGKNKVMSERIALAYLEDETHWQTTLAAPWAYQDDLHVEFKMKELGHELLEDTPHEGTSRYMQQTYYVRKATLARKGLMFKMEKDFYRTPRGKENYIDNIQQLAYAVQATANLDTVVALLECNNYEKMWIQKFGRANVNFMDRVTSEISNYCVTIKEETAFDILIQQHINLMKKEGNAPNLLILWPGAGLWIKMIGPSFETLYHTVGENNNLVEKRGITTPESFRGIPIVESKEYTHNEINSGAHNLQLLARTRSVGEFYTMSPDAWKHSSPITRQEFLTAHRDIWIYNENTDSWERISFIEAFKQAGLFNEDGTYSSILVNLIQSYNDNNRTYDYSESSINSGGIKNMGNGKAPAHWLAQQISKSNTKETFAPVTHFGQIHPLWIGSKDWKRAAETVHDMLDGGNPTVRLANQKLIQDAIYIVERMQSHGYDATFWQALQAKNQVVRDSMEKDLIDTWGQNVLSMQETPHGSLELPDNAKTDGSKYDFPPGYDNYPGFAELASHVGKNDGWSESAEKIAPIVRMIEALASRLTELFPHSGLINVSHRRPWFQKKQAATVLFETLICKASHRPLFILTGNVGNASKQESLNASAKTSLAKFSPEPKSVVPSIVRDMINNPSKTKLENLLDVNFFLLGAEKDIATNEVKLKEQWDLLKDKKKNTFMNEIQLLIIAGKKNTNDDGVLLKGVIEGFVTNAKNTYAKQEKVDGNAFARTPLTYAETLFKSILATVDSVILPSNPNENDTIPYTRGAKVDFIKSSTRGKDDKLHSVFANDVDNNTQRWKRLAQHGYFASSISRRMGSKQKSNNQQRSSIEEMDTRDRFGDEDSDDDIFEMQVKSKKINANTGAKQSAKKQTFDTGSKDKDDVPEYWSLAFHKMYNECRNESDYVRSAIAGILVTLPCDREEHWLDLMHANVYLPISILLARPNITHSVYSGILMVGGIETAMNAFSKTDMEFGSDAKTKMFEGHYTTYMKTLVKDPRRVTIIEDAHPAFYVGGHGTGWMTSSDDINIWISLQQHGRNVPSLLSIVEPINAGKVSLPVISLKGRIEHQNYNEQRKDGSHYNSVEFVHNRFNLEYYTERHITIDGEDTFQNLHFKPNLNVFQGVQFAYNPATKAFSNHKDCQGHLGRDGSQPGAAKCWNGARARLPQFKAQEHILV